MAVLYEFHSVLISPRFHKKLQVLGSKEATVRILIITPFFNNQNELFCKTNY